MLTTQYESVILIADDQPENLQVISNILKTVSSQYNFIHVPNGKILVEVAQNRIPDLIITDWDMPEMGGVEAIKILKANPATSQIPIIVCTGVMSGSQDLKTAMEAGAVDFIRKPIDKLELTARVQSMLKLSMAYRKLEESHQTIARQHHNIVSSVRYAHKIQTALLPTASTLKRALPEFFILYKPRDIVSGDFYWFTETSPTPIYTRKIDEKGQETSVLNGFTESRRIFAVIDCTGHGVPGAFMTMIANTLLNQIVNEKDIHEPVAILYELDKRLSETLRTEDTEEGKKISDGMDLSIMSVGEDEILWAGAKHHLWRVQAGELHEIRGSKFPIGGTLYKTKTFEQHQLAYQKGDIFYMHTDGYIDQMNAERQRFMSKRLKEFLQQIHTQDMETQKTLLEQNLQAWQGNENQIDDILVAGVRL
ncbi:MAG: fused response regulator/phosphatase [Bacteroidetes bacterium]|nr:MAG: fused response regulator/phosphatase [Bacteroidota bacterium]